MSIGIVQEEALLQATGFNERAQLRAWLETNEVPYLPGKRGRIVTTLDALNKALGIAYDGSPLQATHSTVEIG